jgi:hypothetical protein
MALELYGLVHGASEDLVERLVSRIRSTRASHYKDVNLEELQHRCRTLVGEFLHSTYSTRRPFIAYVRSIAGDRISTGFLLHEIQDALSALEEELWMLCHREVAGRERLYRHLVFVSSIIGSAKDQLARLYLAHKEKAEQAMARLQDDPGELFKGTQTAVVADS